MVWAHHVTMQQKAFVRTGKNFICMSGIYLFLLSQLFRWMVVFWAQDSCCSHNWGQSCLLWEMAMGYNMRSRKYVMLISVGISGWDWSWAISVTCFIRCVLTDCSAWQAPLAEVFLKLWHQYIFWTHQYFSLLSHTWLPN